jgi:hypothetical protein
MHAIGIHVLTGLPQGIHEAGALVNGVPESSAMPQTANHLGDDGEPAPAFTTGALPSATCTF